LAQSLPGSSHAVLAFEIEGYWPEDKVDRSDDVQNGLGEIDDGLFTSAAGRASIEGDFRVLASNVRFEAGAYIFKEGNEANSFYVIREGMVAPQISAAQHKPIILETLNFGNILGWSGLFPPFQWKFSAHATTRVRAIALDGGSRIPVAGFVRVEKSSMTTRIEGVSDQSGARTVNTGHLALQTTS